MSGLTTAYEIINALFCTMSKLSDNYCCKCRTIHIPEIVKQHSDEHSLREGKLPNEWKMANIIPLPKSNPPASIHKDIRPKSLTPIAAKVFESIVMEWADDGVLGCCAGVVPLSLVRSHHLVA